MTITEQNFEEILKGGKPVMVDFGATWCGPCKALAPIVEEVAQEYEGRAVVGKADVDECANLAAQYRIRSVPTVIFFKDGQAVDKCVGLVSKSTLTEKLDAIL